MTESNLLKIKDFGILIENNSQNEAMKLVTQPLKEVVGIVYYLSGNVIMSIKNDNVLHQFNKKKGMMSAFFSHQNNVIFQEQKGSKDLRKVSVFLSKEKMLSLIESDEHLKKENQSLLNPQDYFVSGKSSIIQPNIQFALEQIINNQFSGIPRDLFLEGQIIGLLANYFSINEFEEKKNPLQIEKLHFAKEILLEQMNTPPSLSELSKLIGLNTFKLKTGFKELFGVPVFKYLQEKRLEKAFELIENKEMNIQEVAWFVGYESLGSFSNAFKERFGIRPTEIK